MFNYKPKYLVGALLFAFVSVQGSCDIEHIMGRTLVVPRGRSCYKLDLVVGGLLYVDFNNIDCLNDPYTIDAEVSLFDDEASADDKIICKYGEANDTWSGTVTLSESSLTGEDEKITVNNVSKNMTDKTFEAELILPHGCMAPSSEPSTIPASACPAAVSAFSPFKTKAELQAAVTVYCGNPKGWEGTSKYATYG